MSVSFSADGRRVVSGGFVDRTVRVWDAENGVCLEVIQRGRVVAAIAAGTTRYPWRALGRSLETVVELAVTGETVARFSGGLSHVTTHPSGRTWAGWIANHLRLFGLEGLKRIYLQPATEQA